jgi:hypothetical protein
MTRRRGIPVAAMVALSFTFVPFVGAGQSPSPVPDVSIASPTPAGVPAGPVRLRRSASIMRDGVRLRVELERNPMPAGEPTWIRTTVRNVGKDDLMWSHDGCAISVGVRGEMVDATWRPGETVEEFIPGDFKSRTVRWWNGAGPGIGLYFWPARYVGRGEIACADLAIHDRIPPGGVLQSRSMWDGMAYHRLGPPPSGRATVTATFRYYDRPGLDGNSHTLPVSLDAWVVDGRPDDMLHPMEIVDAALDDAAFRMWIEGIEVGNGSTEVIWYDPELDTWEVGVFQYDTNHFQVALVDPRSGDVLGIIERPWREGREPYP